MVSWPELTFGPVNLWSLPPADWFYMTTQQKNQKAKDIKKFFYTQEVSPLNYKEASWYKKV